MKLEMGWKIDWKDFFGSIFHLTNIIRFMDSEDSLNLDLEISEEVKAGENTPNQQDKQTNEDEIELDIGIDDSEHSEHVPTEQMPEPTNQVSEPSNQTTEQTNKTDILDDIDLDIPDNFLDDDLVMKKPKTEPETVDGIENEPNTNTSDQTPDKTNENDDPKPHEYNDTGSVHIDIDDDVNIDDQASNEVHEPTKDDVEDVQIDVEPQASAPVETKSVPDTKQILEEMDKYLDQKEKEFGDEAVEEIKKHLDIHLDDDAVDVIEFEDSQEFDGEKSITDEKVEDKELSTDSEHDESKPAKVVEVDGKKVEISVGKGEDMSAEKLEEKRVQAIKSIKSKASELAKKGLEFDGSIYDQPEEVDKFLRMIVGCMVVPSNSIKAEAQTLHLDEYEHWKIPTDEFIQKVSFYPDFKCFQAPPENLLHSPDEILVICHDLNELFQFNFLDMHSTDFQFNEIPARILKFTNKYADLKTTAFEENFLKAIYSKIEILLNTNVEAAFRSNSIKVTNDFWTAFGGYLKEMEQIQGRQEKLRASWNEFIVALFSMRVKNQIYRHASYSNLNEMLNTCYQPDGFLLIEQLVGNSLKCYFPTIIRSYFFMIRSVYMMARLVAIYSFLKLHEGKSKEQVRKEIYEIGAICTIAYETKYHMWKSEERAPIHGLKNEEISPQVQEYARNHVINGGQYFLLKSIETALPVIADSLP